MALQILLHGMPIFDTMAMIAPLSTHSSRLLLVLSALVFSSFDARAQQYNWTTFVGVPGDADHVDGDIDEARLYQPIGVAIDAGGNVYAADGLTIRKITPAGDVTTHAGSPIYGGSTNGTGTSARFGGPRGLAVDANDNLYVADRGNHTIRKITPSRSVSTLAGQAPNYGSADGSGSSARFWSPEDVAVDSAGNVYVADTLNHTIRKITPDGTVTTLAGSPGISGSANGTGSAARFFQPRGVAVDSSGSVYVADSLNLTIRKITPGGLVSTVAGSPGKPGYTNGTGSAARFSGPSQLAIDAIGNLYVADATDHLIRKITPGRVVSSIGGRPRVNGSANGTGSAARFFGPIGIAVNGTGDLFVGDQYNRRISRGIPLPTPDKTKPIIKITSASETVVTEEFTLSGTVRENRDLSTFRVTLNGIELPLDAPISFTAGAILPWTISSVQPENGTNVILVEAVDSSGNRSTVTKKVNFVNLRPELAGNFRGLLRSVTNQSNSNSGLVSVKIAASGVFSGNIRLSGVNRPFSGILDNNAEARFKPSLEKTLPLLNKTVSLGMLAFSVSAIDGLSGTLSDSSEVFSAFNGQPAPFNKLNLVGEGLLTRPTLGKYNVCFNNAEAIPDGAIHPLGHGYAVLTIKNTGEITLVGKLADGSPYTSSGLLRADSSVPLFTSLYKLRGAFLGELVFADLADTDVAGTDFLWLRPQQLTMTRYPNGWPDGLRVDGMGTKYVPPLSLDFGQATDDLTNGNCSMVLTHGHVAPSPITIPVNVSPATGSVNRVTAPTTNHSLVLKQTTGVINGTFTHTDSKKTAFYGILLNKGLTQGGYGFFLSSPASGWPSQGGMFTLDANFP